MYSFSTDDADCGISIPGNEAVEAARNAVPPIDAVERMVARNLRQPTTCGKEWVRQLLDNPADDKETALAALVAESGTRNLRRDLAGLKAQVQHAFAETERYRRALEAVTSNPHLALNDFPSSLREILDAALAR